MLEIYIIIEGCGLIPHIIEQYRVKKENLFFFKILLAGNYDTVKSGNCGPFIRWHGLEPMNSGGKNSHSSSLFSGFTV